MTMLPFLILILPTLISCFVVQPARIAGGLQFHKNNGLYMSGEEDSTASLPNRRRKRKKKVEVDSEVVVMEEEKEAEPELDWKPRDSAEDDSEAVVMEEEKEAEPELDWKPRDSAEDDSEAVVMEEEKEAEPELDWKPRNSAPVDMQVRDVREILGGVVSSEPSVSAPSFTASPSVSNLESPVMASSASSDDSFKQMLEDARRMQDDSGDDVDSEIDDSIKAKVRNVLSTIVTADFFVVLGFLFWFLAGIAYRAAFDDASVQIAFNNQFEALVQPALGVLMVGTIAGGLLKEEEEF